MVFLLYKSGTLSFSLITAFTFKLVFTPPPPHVLLSHVCVSWCACALYWHCVQAILCARARARVCVCVCVCARARVRVRAILCACVFAMLCIKMFVNFHMFCTIVYLRIVCFF